MLIYFFFFINFFGFLGFIYNRKHLLLILLSLEFIVISLYLRFFFYLRTINYEFFFSLVFLTIRVCEGVLGLSILIYIVRVHGNDLFLSLTSL